MRQSTVAREATFIPFTAVPGKEMAVAGLLAGAAATVQKTEPLTLQWLALREDSSHFAIADFFSDSGGREAHFAGQAAAALKENAAAVEGGWDAGVVAHVENSEVLSHTVTEQRGPKAALAMRVEIEANPGEEEALARVLSTAAETIEATEPATLLWYAIRIGPTRFVVFDVFADEAGKAAHFAGKFAAALKADAPRLVKGGWEQGVVANIRNYQVLSATY